MPQANITYDTVYNRKLVEKMRRDAAKSLVMKDVPTPFPFRLGTFHDPHQKTVMLGGGPVSQYIVNGNSPAYPPLHLRSGMEVSSGGKYAGQDGAVGGSFWKDFARGFSSVLKVAAAPLSFVAPEIGVPLGALGEAVGSVGSGKKRGRPRKGGAIATPMVSAMAGGASSGGVMSGGASSGGVTSGGVMSGGKKAGRPKGSKNKKGGAMSGGGLKEVLNKAIESATPMVKEGMKLAVETLKKKGRKAAVEGLEAIKKKVSGGAMSGGGRAARAAIVKKVMAEKGMKMIAASKYVKEHGLYKPK
jgi:hypothetical protein